MELITKTIIDNGLKLESTSDNFRFSSAVAGLGLLLRDSKYKGDMTYELAKKLAVGSKGKDANGYRSEFVSMIETAELLSEKL